MKPVKNSVIPSVLFISVALMVTGLLLLVYMVTQEGEPGLLPLMMTAAGGLGWTVYKVKSKNII